MFPKRGAIALVTTALALVLLFNFKTPDETIIGAAASKGASTAAASPASGSGAVGGVSAGAAATSPAPTATAPTTSTTRTVTGAVVSTRYGDVEVQVTVAGGKITAVNALELPSGGRSGQISATAGPILSSEALTTQSANIDIVSGATYTSQAYARSLQAALDQAGIASTQATG